MKNDEKELLLRIIANQVVLYSAINAISEVIKVKYHKRVRIDYALEDLDEKAAQIIRSVKPLSDSSR
jgi:hypothetical protein